MAKISPVSIKYIIYAKFEAEGAVEKPDAIGAVFGQTEGLLGSDLELRELQKEGKIGRIDVNLESKNGKTIGTIEIPSALDKTETTIIGAALETIERIGPSDAKIEVEKIEDVRGNKREYIIERAKKLLQKIEGSADTREIGDEVRLSSRISKLQEYGTEKLPAGDISGEEVIIVEGRADVINMLKAGVNNVIAMNGTILPDTIKELSLDKEATLFVDGDRGGDLIIKNVVDNARIDYIVKAPDGKEVEELTAKEILSSLRKKIRVGEFLAESSSRGRGRKRIRERNQERTKQKKSKIIVKKEDLEKEKKEIEKLKKPEVDKLKEIMEDIVGTRAAVLLDKDLKVIKKIPVSQLYNFRGRGVCAVIIDGTATASVVKNVEKINAEHLGAKNFAYAETNIDLISL